MLNTFAENTGPKAIPTPYNVSKATTLKSFTIVEARKGYYVVAFVVDREKVYPMTYMHEAPIPIRNRHVTQMGRNKEESAKKYISARIMLVPNASIYGEKMFSEQKRILI